MLESRQCNYHIIFRNAIVWVIHVHTGVFTFKILWERYFWTASTSFFCCCYMFYLFSLHFSCYMFLFNAMQCLRIIPLYLQAIIEWHFEVLIGALIWFYGIRAFKQNGMSFWCSFCYLWLCSVVFGMSKVHF